jgi:hypothetical protein
VKLILKSSSLAHKQTNIEHLTPEMVHSAVVLTAYKRVEEENTYLTSDYSYSYSLGRLDIRAPATVCNGTEHTVLCFFVFIFLVWDFTYHC